MSRTFSAPAAALASLLAACAAGCDWREFEDYEDRAPVRVYDAPENYRLPRYGQVMTSFTSEGRSVVVASAGADSPVLFQRMWSGRGLSKDAITRCKQEKDCAEGAGVGATLIPFPIWGRGTLQERSGCVLSPGTPKAFVFCDSDTNANQNWDLELVPAPQSTLRFGGAGLPAGHNLGVAILGVHSLSDRGQDPSGGALYYQPDFQPPGPPNKDDVVPLLEVLPLRDPASGELFAEQDEPGDLGYAVAAAPNAAGELVIAIAQPSHERVIIATYDDAIAGGVADKLRTRACLDSPDAALEGFGKRLLVGDVNADGAPEILVGIDPTDPASRAGKRHAVFLYRGSRLPPAEDALSACPPFEGAPDEVECPGQASCDGSGFGASLALADVDGDGANDLLVGAPYTRVGGASEAGAVWVIPARGGEEPQPLDVPGGVLLHAEPRANAQLGMSVAALRTEQRDEPVAGAPGEDRLYTFMCSALETDVSTKSLCLPQ